MSPKACNHERNEWRVMASNNQIILQCLDCGIRLCDARRGQFTGEERAQMNEFDLELRATAWREEQAEAERVRLRQEEERQAKIDAERDAYQDYLRSEEWAIKRQLVMRRCGGICEGCGKEKATEVHHLSYRDKFNEFLFQLVGICRACHKRYHGHDHA